MPLTIPPACLQPSKKAGRSCFWCRRFTRVQWTPITSSSFDDVSLLTSSPYVSGAGLRRLDLRATYDLACNQRDVGTVQNFSLIPSIRFNRPTSIRVNTKHSVGGIAGTITDLIVERAYKIAHGALQKVIPKCERW